MRRPQCGFVGYTLTGHKMLNRVQTEKTIALDERLWASVKKLIVEEGLKNPRITAAVS